MVTWADLDRAAGIARRAGTAILAAASAPSSVELKADASPVTRADRLAHRIIVEALAEWMPDVPVVSEEGEVPGPDVRRGWTRFWLVDPLDGTKEFVKGSDEYTVNIALIDGDAPVMGVVYAPAMGLMYLAGRGLGAWKQEAARERVRVTSRPASPEGPFVIAESRSHPSAAIEAYLRTIPVKARVQAGSSLKFCWVAEGKADLYPRFGPTMEWDTAAGDCVFRMSGLEGERRSPLRYNTPALRHDQFVIGMPEETACR